MTIICAVKKNNEIAISCDTQTSLGSLKVSSKHMVNSNKLYSINKSIIGIAGWSAISDLVEHLLKHDKKLFRLNSRMEIFSTLILLHKKMKDKYFIETRESDDQPVESNQLDALIVNSNGLFVVGSYREVNEYNTFCAIGSGRRLALGAIHSLYEMKLSAKQIAEAGVKAAAEFDDGCGLPFKTRVLKLT